MINRFLFSMLWVGMAYGTNEQELPQRAPHNLYNRVNVYDSQQLPQEDFMPHVAQSRRWPYHTAPINAGCYEYEVALKRFPINPAIIKKEDTKKE